MAYRVALGLLRGFFGGGWITCHVSGREHLPPPGSPAITPINHSSALDVCAGYVVNRPGYYAIKRESTEVPILGPFLQRMGGIAIQRDEQDTEALRQMREVLRAGHILGIAPEGTRSRTGRVGRYDPGFVWLAARTGAVVVPIALHGAGRLLPKGARFPRRGEIWARVGEPISFEAEGRRISRERMQVLADEVRDRTLAMLRELVAESGVPNPALLEDGTDAGTDAGSVALPHVEGRS
jgi:1-acyl-sn-glycerol-3-phosphate acyltransferase